MAEEEKDDRNLSRIVEDAKKRRINLGKIDLSLKTQQELASFIKSELEMQIYPMIEGLAAAARDDIEVEVNELSEEIDHIDATLGMVVEQSSDLLHKPTADAILSAFQTARALAQELDAIAAGLPDELHKKRIADATKVAREQFGAIETMVNSITLDPQESEDEEGEEGEDD